MKITTIYPIPPQLYAQLIAFQVSIQVTLPLQSGEQTKPVATM